MTSNSSATGNGPEAKELGTVLSLGASAKNFSIKPPTPDETAPAVVSLPWPPAQKSTPAVTAAGVRYQSVPLFKNDSVPLPRYLLLMEASNGSLPDQLSVAADTAAQNAATDYEQPATPQSQVEIATVGEGTEPYRYREDEARLRLGKRTIGLRLGLELNDGLSWWQWTRAECLWHGAVADAWRIGGHIVSHTLQGTPQIPDELNMFEGMRDFGGQQIAADAYVILFHSGVIQITAHFKNNFWMVPAEDVPGLPVIALAQLEGDFAEQTLDGAETLIHGSAGDRLDISDSQAFFDKDHTGRIKPLGPGEVLFRPFENTEITTHKTKENEFLYLGEARQKCFPSGVSRSVRLNIGLNGRNPQIMHYTVPPAWYGRCGVFNGVSQPSVSGRADEWAGHSRHALYSCTHRGGFDTGRVWRYLRRDQRLGIPQIDDAEWEGGTPQALLLDWYRHPDKGDRDLILHQLYHYADIAVNHDYMMVRCHGYNTMHAPLPMMRVGSLVLGYAETGDPYLLETARGVADSFMRMDESCQPRHSIGRDAYPLAGLMTLYDYTGDRRYLDFGSELVQRTLATQTPAGGFSGQGGVGLQGGRSNQWNDRDISFGSGLLAPIAIYEWALRDDRHPPGFREQMMKWYELALSLQREEGWWPQRVTEESYSYPLIVAGLIFNFSAYHRLYGDTRGLQALERYFNYALAQEDWLLGTHSFLGVLYTSFYEMERVAAGLAAASEHSTIKTELTGD